MTQALEPTKQRFYATVVMVKPYTDYWLKKPSKDDVLETMAELIHLKQLDSHFQIDIRE